MLYKGVVNAMTHYLPFNLQVIKKYDAVGAKIKFLVHDSLIKLHKIILFSNGVLCQFS